MLRAGSDPAGWGSGMGLTLGAGFTFSLLSYWGSQCRILFWGVCVIGVQQKGVSGFWLWPHPQRNEFLRVGSLGYSPPPCRGFVGGPWGAASFPAGYGMGLGVPAGHCGEGWGLLGYRISPGGKGREGGVPRVQDPVLLWDGDSIGCRMWPCGTSRCRACP